MSPAERRIAALRRFAMGITGLTLVGHLWLGFAQDQTRAILGEAGFDAIRVVPLPPDSRVKGPGLFAATAVKRH